MVTAYPDTICEAAAIVRGTAGHGCIQITGNASHYPVEAGTPALSSARYSGIEIYRPEDCSITVRAGTPIARIAEVTALQGQRLALDPTTRQQTPGPKRAPTIGGAVAMNTRDPGASFLGGLRHSVLGMRFINGSGEIIDAGSRAIKNVAGIDLAGGLVGSWGNLALICDLTLRLFPLSNHEQTGAVTVHGRDEAMQRTHRSPAGATDMTADRLTARIKQAFDPKGVFSSKPYLSRKAS